MPLTRDFRETIQARVERDLGFRRELLKEGIDCLLSGEVEVGKTVLRDFINATGGFHPSQQLLPHQSKFTPPSSRVGALARRIEGCLRRDRSRPVPTKPTPPTPP